MSKQVVLAGFHAVNARVRLKPESVKVVYVDAQRRDKRMHECCARLNKSGIKVVQADARRLDGLAPDLPHQGVVALADEIVNTLTFDELLDSITDKTLLLILDGVTDPRNFGACLRRGCAGGCGAQGPLGLFFAGSGQSCRRRLGNSARCKRHQPCRKHCGTSGSGRTGGGNGRRSGKVDL